jgi:hypothetical protein
VVADRLAVSLGENKGLRPALEQELQARWPLALLGDDLAGADMASAGKRDPRCELGVVEAVEQVDAAKLCKRDRCVAHA